MVSHRPASERGPPYRVPSVVVIGTSAGGLTALSDLLSNLPADLPAAVLIVQHISPTFKSQLAEILRARTALPVRQARSGMRMKHANVYIAPPDQHLMVKDSGLLMLSGGEPVNYSRPAIDPLFISAAVAFKERVLAVMLSGFGKDGSEGVRAVHEHGGHVIAQNEETSEHFAMPRAAIGTGCVDYVLPLAKIPEQILKLLQDHD
jgi:two-component system, chemotaxis family, protein-glutamate methylesterase/glutaminase